MRYVLLSMTVNGIKNIDREIELQLSNKILNRELDIHHQNVKAIYGPNGSGKTGIVYAVSVYQNTFTYIYDFMLQFSVSSRSE